MNIQRVNVKNVLMVLPAVLFLTGVKSYGQIEMKESPKVFVIGSVKPGARTIAELTRTVIDSDTAYGLTFSNAKYTTLSDYKTVIFRGSETIDQLYNLMKTVFTDENKKNKDYKIDFKLGDNDVSIMNYRVMGITSMWFWSDGAYFYLSEKQVDKLFGK